MEVTVTYLLIVSICQFKSSSCELDAYSLYLGNISKDFTVDNMIQKTGLHGYVYDFSIDYGSTDADDVVDIDKYLMK